MGRYSFLVVTLPCLPRRKITVSYIFWIRVRFSCCVLCHSHSPSLKRIHKISCEQTIRHTEDTTPGTWFQITTNSMLTNFCLFMTNRKYVILLDHPWILRWQVPLFTDQQRVCDPRRIITNSVLTSPHSFPTNRTYVSLPTSRCLLLIHCQCVISLDLFFKHMLTGVCFWFSPKWMFVMYWAYCWTPCWLPSPAAPPGCVYPCLNIWFLMTEFSQNIPEESPANVAASPVHIDAVNTIKALLEERLPPPVDRSHTTEHSAATNHELLQLLQRSQDLFLTFRSDLNDLVTEALTTPGSQIAMDHCIVNEVQGDQHNITNHIMHIGANLKVHFLQSAHFLYSWKHCPERVKARAGTWTQYQRSWTCSHNLWFRGSRHWSVSVSRCWRLYRTVGWCFVEKAVTRGDSRMAETALESGCLKKKVASLLTLPKHDLIQQY